MKMAVGSRGRRETRDLVDFSELLEGCTSDVIAFTAPVMPAVSSVFKSAAD